MMNLKSKSIVFLVIILFAANFIFAYESIENLKLQISNSVGKKKVDLLNELSEEYRKIHSPESMKSANDALQLAGQLKYLKGMAQAFHQLAYYERQLKNYDIALDYYLKALDIWQELNLPLEVENESSNMAFVYTKTGEYFKAKKYFQKALEINVALDDSMGIAASYNNMGSTVLRLGNYAASLDYFYKALKIKENLLLRNPNDEKNIKSASTFNNIGNIHLRMEKYDKALEAYFNVLKIIETCPSDFRKANAYNNIGIVYEQLGEYNKALDYFNKSLSINQQLDKRKKIGTIMNNIGIVYEKQGKLPKAIYYYELSLEIKKSMGDKYGIANAQKNLGSVYLSLAKYHVSCNLLQKSLTLAREIGARDIVKEDYKFLAECYAAQKKYKLSYEYELQHIVLKDSIMNESTAVELATIESNYQLEKKEKENEILSKNNQIYRLNIEKARLASVRSYMLAAIVTLLALFLLLRIRHNKKLSKILQQSRNHLEIKVEERTSDLAITNAELEKEIEERKKIEEQITASLQEKEVLLREIHHRVKNNLQIICSILNLQVDKVMDKDSQAMFNNTKDRVFSMSLIHEKLYIEDNLARIDIGNYISGLVNYLLGTYFVDPHKIRAEIAIKKIYCGVSTAVPCGLIINEIISNSIKYAFPDGRKGKLFVRMDKDNNGNITLIAGDDGVGNCNEIIKRKEDSVGLNLIELLSKQLQAKVECTVENGVVYKFVFKELNE